MKYVVEPVVVMAGVSSSSSSESGRMTLSGSQIARAKNQLTKDKLYMLVKKNSETNASNGNVWTLSERVQRRFATATLKFTDIYSGPPPAFPQTLPITSSSSTSTSKTSAASPRKQQQQQKQQPATPQQTKQTALAKASSSSTAKSKAATTPHAAASKAANASSSSSSSSSGKQSKITDYATTAKKTAAANPKAVVAEPVETEEEKWARHVVHVLGKRVCDMSDAELVTWRAYVPDEDLKELHAYEHELDKQNKKNERERERERARLDKLRERQLQLELKNPKDDLELLEQQQQQQQQLALPRATPIKAKMSQSMFGDAVMLLEFLAHFGELFQLRDDFPNGFGYELLENALFSRSADSALCNLLLFYLDSVFKCYDEETFDEEGAGGDSSDDDSSDVLKEEQDQQQQQQQQENEAKSEEEEKEERTREALAAKADELARLVRASHGRSLKNIGLDVYTISEMLRLYFLTSGSTHHSKTKFWYQQRGGYTRMDEAGIDFALNEPHIVDKLGRMSVYELEPGFNYFLSA